LTDTNTKFRFSVVQDDFEREKLPFLSEYAFFPSPGDLKRQKLYFNTFKDSYILAVYDEINNSRVPIATATSIRMTQNIRGKIFPMDGVANVATEPMYRRKHITTEMIKRIFSNDKETGLIVSTLFPFKESFYNRFGYITLPQTRIATLSLNNISFLLKEKDFFKSQKFNLKDDFSLFYNFASEIQKKTHGMCLKSEKDMKFRSEISPAHLVFVYDNEDKPIGCMTYSTKGFHNEIEITNFLYLNSQGKYFLFKFLALHIDQFTVAKFPVKPNENPENWFNDLEIKISSREWIPAAMARIITVENLEGLPVGTGSFIVKIIDNYCDWNNNIYEFSSKNGFLTISKKDSGTTINGDLTIEGLTALVYGCYVLEDFLFKKWISNHDSDLLDKFKLFFPLDLPFMFDSF
jgi:predicted acetyltransferase